MPTKDLTQFDKIDPSGNLEVTADQVTVTGLRNDVDASVSEDAGVGHYTYPLTHDWEYEQNGQWVNVRVQFWCISNLIEDSYHFEVNDSPAIGVLLRDSWTYQQLKLHNYAGNTVDISVNLNFSGGVRYYNTSEWTSPTTLEVRICTDSARLVLVDVISLVVPDTSYQFLFAVNSHDRGIIRNWSGVFANLDLNEAPSFIPFPHPRGLDGGGLSINGGMM